MIAASALMELGALVPVERVRARYRDIGRRTLQGACLARLSRARRPRRRDIASRRRPSSGALRDGCLVDLWRLLLHRGAYQAARGQPHTCIGAPVAAPRKTAAEKATTTTGGAKCNATEMRAKADVGAGAPVSLGTADSRIEIDAEASIMRWRGAPITLSPVELALLRTLVVGIGDAVPARALLRTAKRIEPDAAKGKGLRLGRETIVSLRRIRDVDRGFTAIAVSPGLGYLWVKER